MIGRTDKLIKEVKEVLEWDILKFWSAKQDPQGGFYSEEGEEAKSRKDSTRDEHLNARILWAFSVAYRIFKKKEYLMPAMNAKDFFVQHFLDHKFGGAYTTVDGWGERIDTDAHLSNQALAVYALSEYYGATKDDEALKAAVNLYKIVKKQFQDADNGGFYENLARDFSVKDDTKEAVSHIYLLEGLANLYRVWKDEGLRNDIKDLLNLISDKFYNVKTGHLIPRFDKVWNEIPSGNLYGVDLEASWSVLDAAYATEDVDAVNVVKDMTARLLMYGMEGMMEDGHVAYRCDENGKLDEAMVPSVQAEAVIANLCGWKYQCFAEGADNAFRIWEYIKAHQSAGANTNAFRRYPMHAARACVQTLRLFR